MNRQSFKTIGLMLVLTGFLWNLAITQERVHPVTDVVDLSGELGASDLDQQGLYGWTIGFNESWNISPQKSSIRKSVISYKPVEPEADHASGETHQKRFEAALSRLPLERGSIHLSITHEFLLLDTIDIATGRLRRDLIALVQSSYAGKWFDLNTQLLSVIFHEEWIIDPGTYNITKKVEAITPVAWQRRQTCEGDPLNDAESGLPVYFKNQLHRIGLRNP